MQKTPLLAGYFERISDEHGAITYRLIHGDTTFSDSDFPRVMQAIHERSQEVYSQLAFAYFEMDKDTKAFVEEADGRYKLLPQEERIKNLAVYISEHPSLSSASQRWLKFLASHATDLEKVVINKEQAKESGLSSQRKYIINRFAAIKDLAYGCTFSGVKTDDKYDWRMGYDPIVFSTGGTLAASRGTQKAGIMDSTMTYDLQTLEIVKASERKLGKYLVEKGKQDSSLPYQPGPQLLAA